MNDSYDALGQLFHGILNGSPDASWLTWKRKVWPLMDIDPGDILKLKKKHPCGSYEWEVLRTGADFRLKCTGCGHQIMIARKQAEKNVKKIKKQLANPE